MKEIAKQVAKYYGLQYEVMFLKTRLRNIVRPRQMAMLLIREHLKYATVQATGEFFGKNHATVTHSIRAMKDDIRLYPDTRKDYIQLKHVIFGGFKPKNKYYRGYYTTICLPCVNHIFNPKATEYEPIN